MKYIYPLLILDDLLLDPTLNIQEYKRAYWVPPLLTARMDTSAWLNFWRMNTAQ